MLGDPNYDQLRRESYQLGYLFEHHLNDTWTLRQNLRWSKVNIQNRSAFNNGYASATSPMLLRLASDIKRNIQIFNVDNQAQARFNTGALEHTLLMGVDFRRNALDNDVVNGTFTSINPYSPTYNSSVSNQYVGRDMYQTQKQTGIYLQDQIKLDRWILTLGGRYDWAKATSDFRPDRATPRDRVIKQNDEKRYLAGGPRLPVRQRRDALRQLLPILRPDAQHQRQLDHTDLQTHRRRAIRSRREIPAARPGQLHHRLGLHPDPEKPHHRRPRRHPQHSANRRSAQPWV
ncbi:TonB-dependent receptor [Pseudomonas poae]|nr:TonB-dependent receptor [Pseudomonas poae]